MHRCRSAAHQWVPLRKILSVREPAIGAARWQPVKFFGSVYRQHQAFCDLAGSVCIVIAPARVEVEQFTRNIRVVHITCFFVFDLVHATQSTAVAKPFPFVDRHLCQ